MPPATRSKRALEGDKVPVTRSSRTTRSLAAKTGDQERSRTTRSTKTADPIQVAESVRDEQKKIQKRSGAKTAKRRKPKHDEILADEQDHPPDDIAEKQPGLSLNNDEDDQTAINLGQIDGAGEPKDKNELYDQIAKDAELEKAVSDIPPEEILNDIPPRQTTSNPPSPTAVPADNIDGDFSTAVTNRNQLTVASSEVTAQDLPVTTVPPIPQRPRPQPVTRSKDRGAVSTDMLDYDGNLMERVRSMRLKDQAVALAEPETCPAVETLFDDGDDEAPVSKAAIENDRPAEVPEVAHAHEDSDSASEFMSRGRQRIRRQVYDSDSDDEYVASPHPSPPAQSPNQHVVRCSNSDTSNTRQDNTSPRRYTAAEKGKQSQVAPAGARKAKQGSSNTMALYADDSEGDVMDDGNDTDEAEDVDGHSKRGPFPSWALEEAQEIRLKVAEYTKTVVKPAYDAFINSKDDETTLFDHFKDIRKFYESAQKESNKQRQEDGNAAASVNLVTAKFKHLCEWSFLNHDVHVISFIFSLAKDKLGRDLQDVCSGSPHMKILHSNMHSNIHQSLEDIRGELIVANTRLRKQTLDPSPEPWLHFVDFFPKAANERDRHRRVLPEILRHLANHVVVTNHKDPTIPLPRPLTSFPWARWPSIAFKYHLTLVQWPAHLSPCPGQKGFDLHAISSADMSKIVRVWRNYKDNELSDPDAEDRVHIVSWSQNEKAYELEDQKNIPLVVNSDGEVVVKVQSVPEYLKLVGKHTKARELEEARTERRKPKGKGRHHSPPPEPQPRSRALPPRPAYREIDDYDAPMADPNKPRGAAVGPNASRFHHLLILVTDPPPLVIAGLHLLAIINPHLLAITHLLAVIALHLLSNMAHVRPITLIYLSAPPSVLDMKSLNIIPILGTLQPSLAISDLVMRRKMITHLWKLKTLAVGRQRSFRHVHITLAPPVVLLLQRQAKAPDPAAKTPMIIISIHHRLDLHHNYIP
ncbi:hypothetical protein EYR40_006064 [Pleurotus pulmonarius]|nr:hypothetical protein EYR40_006064 [Pleurotus pulmonarius]